jgi:hypothetical protein
MIETWTLTFAYDTGSPAGMAACAELLWSERDAKLMLRSFCDPYDGGGKPADDQTLYPGNTDEVIAFTASRTDDEFLADFDEFADLIAAGDAWFKIEKHVFPPIGERK